MFIKEHYQTMTDYYKLIGTFPKYQFPEDCISSTKKFYLLRIAATFEAFKGAIAGVLIQSTQALNELVIGALHVDKASFKNAAYLGLGALIDGLALPIIGIVGMLFPAGAFSLAELVNEKAMTIMGELYLHEFQTSSFNEVTARVISPLRGATFAFCDAVQTANFTISMIICFPVFPQLSIQRDIIIPFFRGTTLIPGLCESGIDLFAGPMGIFSQESRNYLRINP